MRKRIGEILTLLALWGLALPSLAQESQEAFELSLDECINYALENSISSQNAKLEEERSAAQVKEFTALGLPQVKADVGFTHNMKIQTSFISDFITPATYGVLFQEGLVEPRDLGEPETFPAAFGTDFSGRAGVSVSQLVFDGSYFVGLQASKTVKELAAKQAVQTDIDVAEKVSQAYFNVLVAQKQLELLAKNLGRIDSLLRDTEILEQNGFVEKIDVSRIKVNYNNTKTALANARDMLVVSVSLLKFQMGMPINERLKLTQDLEDFNLEAPEVVKEFDYVNRIEYSILQTSDYLNDLDMKNYRMQYLPRLYAGLNAGYTAGTNTFGDLTNFDSETWFDYSNWGLMLNIPIFDGFQKRYAIQQRKLKKLQIENQFETTKNSIDLNIQTAISMLNSKRGSLEAQRENMDLAEEVYRVTEIKYKEGVGSNSEVLDADASLKAAQTNYYNALYEALVAKVSLEKAYGTLLK